MTENTKPEVDEFDDIDEVAEAPVEEAAKEEKPAKAKKAPAKKPAAKKAKAKKEDELPEGAKVITYVGQGETPPRKINFINRQEFVRGRPTVVTDAIVLAKIEGNQCFVEGEVDPEEIADMDEEAAKAANAQRAEDKAVDAAYKKKHG